MDYGQISPGQVVSAAGWWRGGAGRWLGPLLTYLTMWTLGHWRNILIYLTMTLLTRRRDTALNEETHFSITSSTKTTLPKLQQLLWTSALGYIMKTLESLFTFTVLSVVSHAAA